MAELATIARPYAEALFKANGQTSPRELADQLDAVAQVANLTELRQFADNPKVQPAAVYDVIVGALKSVVLSSNVQNLLRTVIDNGRLAAMPEIAAQYRELVNAQSGVSDATVYSAFPIDGTQLADVVASLQKRFNRKLNATVVVEPELIGGIRVVVGDEVLDTSVKARLELMKVALTA
ncbi:F0F1 ATP synthase subunit delta [Piscinibacter sp.]|uniref:F0F1 ATP synthase subunit delta n=1 Tax=Piscinibacter sp. TaxID=1903157 RepID=UPI002C8DF20A|nr:F0F1 ATP synthase subunit delta [Albitalea sp.]HUG26139.1 F0F1 ATP synthase subunit delta [Albitalea sp.]